MHGIPPSARGGAQGMGVMKLLFKTPHMRTSSTNDEILKLASAYFAHSACTLHILRSENSHS